VVFAAVHAQRCRSLVAIGAPISAYPLKDRLRTQALVALYRTTGPQEIVVEAVTKALLSARTRQDDPEALELVRSSFTGADRAGTLNAVESIWLHRPDLTPMLSLVRVPTLFITGTAHPDWSPEQAQDAAGLLPHGSAEAIDGTAYLAALEAPEEVAGLVRRFWASAS
jgi:pimeloyl-ACP methyl ester carboxylesterase